MALQVLINVFIICFIVSSVNAAGDGDWGYEWPGTVTVSEWNSAISLCNGVRQSPIAINTSTAKYDSNLGNITMTNYDEIKSGVNFSVTNGGKGFVVGFKGFTNATVPTIKDGGLPGTFELAQYHFHWGAENNRGSEHVKDGESYPAELHLVHFNRKYGDIGKALNKSDGLAVLGVFIKVGARNPTYENFLNMTKYNVIYNELTFSFDQGLRGVDFSLGSGNAPSWSHPKWRLKQATAQITSVNQSNSSQVRPFKLMELLPMDKSFYRYNGSLTTPDCQESVTWTVFDKDIEISQDQLEQFRMMKYLVGNATGDMVDTFRPPQPLKNRVVYTNFEGVKHQPSMSSTPTSSTPTSSSPTSSISTPTTPDKPTTTGSTNLISGNLSLLVASVMFALLSFFKI